MNTITAGDFTVEMDINEKMYKHYIEEEYEKYGVN